MLGLFHRPQTFAAPPCFCDDIEARVREACAMRDEMATWPTPVEAWRKLQEMPVLAPKGQPQPNTWGKAYEQALKPVASGSTTVPPYLTYGFRSLIIPSPPPPPIPYIRHRCDACGADLISGHFSVRNPGVLGLEMYVCWPCERRGVA